MLVLAIEALDAKPEAGRSDVVEDYPTRRHPAGLGVVAEVAGGESGATRDVERLGVKGQRGREGDDCRRDECDNTTVHC